MLVSSTSMKVAIETMTAINHGLTPVLLPDWGRDIAVIARAH